MPNSGELTLTWSRFFSPAGSVIDGFGVRPEICTTAGPGVQGDLDGVLRTLRADVAVSSRYRKLTANRQDLEALRRDFRASCPPSQAEPEADMTLAKRLITDRGLYARAVTAAHPSRTSAYLGQPVAAAR
jgi:carboxyl-terminal processing protease